MKHTIVAVDLAKSVFQVAVSHQPGRVAEHHRLSRTRFSRFLSELEPTHVLMEVCGSAHYWGRECLRHGHRVSLLPPHRVRSYRSGNKTDRADTKAILEAFRNEEIQPVPVKSVDQQMLASLHRFRSAWLASRNARLNTIRGLLRELGITIPVGAKQVLPRVSEHLGDPDSAIPHALKPILAEALQDVRDLERRMQLVERQLQALAQHIPAVEHLMSIPGIGILTATALVALVGDIHRFPSARRFASFLGLVPREFSSGTTRRLGSISKRGDTYVRMLLTHGARSVLWAAKAKKEPDPFRTWALNLEQRRGHNIATLAVANKLARFAWAVWREERTFQNAA